MTVFVDNCKFTPTAGGTSDFTYSAALQGFQSPSAACIINGETYTYFALSNDLTQWELGRGSYNTGTGVLARTTVLYNSSATGTSTPGQSGAGTKINFSTTPAVSIVALAEDVLRIILPQGRLSLATGTFITTTDITGTVIYYTGGGYVPIYDGTYWTPVPFTELNMALDATNTDPGYHQNNHVFDVFIANNLGTYIGSGPTWSTTVSRGTGAGTTELVQQDGILVNKNTITLRYGNSTGNTASVPAKQATYLGSFYCSADGQTKDGKNTRYLFNAYNQQPRPFFGTDTVNTTAAFGSAAWTRFNGNGNNVVFFLCGLDGVEVYLAARTIYTSATASPCAVLSGIDLDNALVNLATSDLQYCPSSSNVATAEAVYEGFPGIGLHVLGWMWYNFSAGSPNATGLGTNGGAAVWTPGLNGRIWA